MDAHTGTTHYEDILVAAGTDLSWDDVPEDVRRSVRRLFLDWLGSALAGSHTTPVLLMSRVTRGQGWLDPPLPGDGLGAGRSTVLASGAGGPPLAAALLNAAAGHVVEMDDLHNASIYHPGTCVFPAALAVGESVGANGTDFFTAAVAAYEVSLRVGEALGPEHYVFFHTTGTAGALGAAVAAGRLLGLDRRSMLWALGSAATQAAGLWQFLTEGAMSKQLHTAKAAFNGVLAAYLAAEGFTGPEKGVTGARGLLAATTAAGVTDASARDPLRARQLERLLAGVDSSDDRDPTRARIRTFKTPEVSIKLHASCRHTHPAVDALLAIMKANGLEADDLAEVRAHVYSGAHDRLKDVEVVDPWSAKFNLPFCLAQAALRGTLDLGAFTLETIADGRVRDLMDRMSMRVDPALDSEYPRRWPAWVEVKTRSGASFTHRVDTPKGDPENPLSDAELENKFLSLAEAALPAKVASTLLSDVADLAGWRDVGPLLQRVRASAATAHAARPTDSEFQAADGRAE